VPCPHSLRRSDGGLCVLKVRIAEGAYAAMVRLESLPGEEQPLQDADVVSWELGQEKPAHHALYNTKKEGCLSGGFWGLLFGLVFPVPGLPAGAASEAPWGHIRTSGSATPSSGTFGTRSRRALRRFYLRIGPRGTRLGGR
jgi:hypothetical protein